MSEVLKCGNYDSGDDNEKDRNNRRLIHQELFLGIYVKIGWDEGDGWPGSLITYP